MAGLWMVLLGDKVFVKGDFGVRHYGVYVGLDWQGNEMVVQNLKGRSVQETSVQEFSGGRQIFIEQRARSWQHGQEIVQRAQSLMGISRSITSIILMPGLRRLASQSQRWSFPRTARVTG